MFRSFVITTAGIAATIFLLILLALAIILLSRKVILPYMRKKCGKSRRQMEYEKMNIQDL